MEQDNLYIRKDFISSVDMTVKAFYAQIKISNYDFRELNNYIDNLLTFQKKNLHLTPLGRSYHNQTIGIIISLEIVALISGIIVLANPLTGLLTILIMQPLIYWIYKNRTLEEDKELKNILLCLKMITTKVETESKDG